MRPAAQAAESFWKSRVQEKPVPSMQDNAGSGEFLEELGSEKICAVHAGQRRLRRAAEWRLT